MLFNLGTDVCTNKYYTSTSLWKEQCQQKFVWVLIRRLKVKKMWSTYKVMQQLNPLHEIGCRQKWDYKNLEYILTHEDTECHIVYIVTSGPLSVIIWSCYCLKHTVMRFNIYSLPKNVLHNTQYFHILRIIYRIL